jgi:hypothetical protein
MALAADETPAQKKATDPVRFSVSIGADYTDNRDGAPNTPSLTDPTFTKESTMDFYLSPSVALEFQWEMMALEMSYTPSYRYRSNPNAIQNESQLFHDLQVNFSRYLTKKLQLRLLEHFNITDDPSVQENGTTLRRDSSFVLNQTEAGLKYDFSRLSNVDIVGRYMVKRYDEVERRIESDEEKADAGIVLWHQPAKSFVLVGMATLSDYGYEKYGTLDRGFSTTVIGGGIEQVFSQNFRCGLRGGVQMSDYNDKSVGSESTPYGTFSLQMSTIPSTRITALLSRMIRNALVFPFYSQEATEFGLRLDWDSPVPELRFALHGGYSVGEYDVDKLPTNFGTDTTLQDLAALYGFKSSGSEKILTLALEASYKVGFGTTIKLAQSFEDVNSEVRWSFTRNATSLSLTREF